MTSGGRLRHHLRLVEQHELVQESPKLQQRSLVQVPLVLVDLHTHMQTWETCHPRRGEGGKRGRMEMGACTSTKMLACMTIHHPPMGARLPHTYVPLAAATAQQKSTDTHTLPEWGGK